MSYVKHNFKSGDIIYASDANDMENQIALNEQNISNLSNDHTQIQTIQQNLNTLMEDYYYVNLKVNSFEISPSTLIVGTAINNITCDFNLSKIPDTLTIDGISQTPAKTGSNISISFSEIQPQSVGLAKTIELVVTDSKHTGANSVKASAKLYAYNIIYYGSAAMPNEINDTFIANLQHREISNKKSMELNKSSVDINIPAGQHFWYVIPSRLGNCKFVIGGFETDFNVVTMDITNSSNFVESYKIYYSKNKGLGSPTITIS